MIEVDAIAQRHKLLRVVLLGNLVNGVQQSNNIVCEALVKLLNLLRKC